MYLPYMHPNCGGCLFNCNNESITDAIATTANDNNSEMVDGKEEMGLMINDKYQMLKMEERLSTTTK